VRKETTAIRLKKIMAERNLRQVDILELAKPFCEKYNVKMNKSDLSQYCSGKTEPHQEKLYILGCALNVSESWLMGFDVPMERRPSEDAEKFSTFANVYNERRHEKIIAMNLSDSELSIIEKYRYIDDYGKHTVNVVLDSEYDRCKDESENTIQLTDEEIERLKLERYFNSNSELLVARKKR